MRIIMNHMSLKLIKNIVCDRNKGSGSYSVQQNNVETSLAS